MFLDKIKNLCDTWSKMFSDDTGKFEILEYQKIQF